MLHGVGADRERQAVAIPIAMIFMPFPRLVGPTSAPPPFAITKVASMKHSSSSSCRVRASLAMSIENAAQTSLRHRSESGDEPFVVRIALREHVPLRADARSPERPFKNMACRDRPAARPPVRNVFFGKVIANPLPLQMARPKSFHTYSGSTVLGNFEIGSSENINPCQVAARAGEAGDKAAPDRVFADEEHDGGRGGCRLGSERRISAGSRGDHGDLSAKQIRRPAPAAGQSDFRPSRYSIATFSPST